MADHFSILLQPRRPWLDAGDIKESFHRLSASRHPDVTGPAGESDSAALNAAYAILRDPVSRLRHLLELEAPESLDVPGSIPADLVQRFMRIAEFKRGFDGFQKKESAAFSLVARALLASEKLALMEQGNAVQIHLESAYEDGLSMLRQIDSEWTSDSATKDRLRRCAEVLYRCVYLSKWRGQLSEMLFQLRN